MASPDSGAKSTPSGPTVARMPSFGGSWTTRTAVGGARVDADEAAAEAGRADGANRLRAIGCEDDEGAVVGRPDERGTRSGEERGSEERGDRRHEDSGEEAGASHANSSRRRRTRHAGSSRVLRRDDKD